MKTLYFDCFAGISGDMTIGALLDLGQVTPDYLQRELAKLGLSDEYELHIEKKAKWGVTGTDVHVHMTKEHDPHEHLEHAHAHGHVQAGEHEHMHAHDHAHPHAHDEPLHDHAHPHVPGEDGHTHSHESEHDHIHRLARGYGEIRQIIENSAITQGAKDRAQKIFYAIAKAEAEVHGNPIDQVHFHEVGATDAIVDIVGTAILLDALGIEKIVCSPIHVGSGMTRAAHGVFGVPAPATALILQGKPIYQTQVKGELCTPTGAAIAAAMADEFGPMPAMTADSVGHGLGKKEFGILNFLRVFMGQTQGTQQEVCLSEANLDDMTAEAVAFAEESIWQAGALDVWTESICMKKGRLGVKLCALYAPDNAAVVPALLRCTSTLGVRTQRMQRAVLERRCETVETPYGPVRLKWAARPGGETAKPEYEDVQKAARAAGVSYQTVAQAALDAANKSMRGRQ